MLSVIFREISQRKAQYKGRGKLTEQMRKKLASSMRCVTVNRSKAKQQNKSSSTPTKGHTELCSALLW